MAYVLTEQLRLPEGPVSLDAHDPAATPGFSGGKGEARRALEDLGPELAELQEKLFANAYVGGTRRVLLVLQGMDTSGKAGVVHHALGSLSAQGVKHTSFRRPTEEELAHDFLWRVDKALPPAGVVGVFDRSHYEDVLAAEVHEAVGADEVERRYGAINEFEKALVDQGTVIIKCFLHLSYDEQRERLLARLDDPAKRWKFEPGDVDERGRWTEYQRAYTAALERCHTPAAPWYVVASDRNWYRNWAVGTLLLEALRGMELEWPTPDYDVSEQRARLAGDEKS